MPEGMSIASPGGTGESVFSGMVECPKLGGQAEMDVVREVRDDWCRTRGLKCCAPFDISLDPAEQDMVDCVHEKSPGGPVKKSYDLAYFRDETCRKLGLYCCMGLSEQALKRAMGGMEPYREAAAMNIGDLVVKLKDHELAGFPDMPEDQCDVRGDFINCAVNGKYRHTIKLPACEICPVCGTPLKKAR